MPRLYNKWLPWKPRETQDKPKVWNHYLECPWPTLILGSHFLDRLSAAEEAWNCTLLHKQVGIQTASEGTQMNGQQGSALNIIKKSHLAWILYQIKCKPLPVSPVYSKANIYQQTIFVSQF